MNRTTASQTLNRKRAALLEQIGKLKQAADSADATYEKWREPERLRNEAHAAWKLAEAELHHLTDTVECELNADATEVLKPFRDHLCEIFQIDRHKYDRREDGPEGGKRLAAIRAGIAQLDQLAISGRERHELIVDAKKILAGIPPRDLGLGGVRDESTKKREVIGDLVPFLVG